jgi:cell wall-associated NlpC family hydrolase
MTLEEFVRAAGAAMGLARDAFGTGAADQVAAANAPPARGGPGAGSGRAAEALDAASGQLNAHAAALGEHDGSAHTRLTGALAAAASGRARMDAIIDAATADVQRLAPASTTPQGRRALVTALTRRLQETHQTLQDGHADATTRAAASHTAAADYHAVAQPSPSAGISALAASGTSMGAMPLAGLSGMPGVVGLQPGRHAGGSAAGRAAADAAVPEGNTVNTVVSRALSQRGTPSSPGGGGKTGPGPGDDGRVGFDCSSLMQYAFAGAGVDLPRTTYEQFGLGRIVPPGGIQAGDLVFSNFDSCGPAHVQLAISPSHVVEAPQPEGNVRVSVIPSDDMLVRRIL